MRAIFIICCFSICLSFKFENENRNEYNKTITKLISKIQKLKNFDYEILNGKWRSRSRNGFYTFEGGIFNYDSDKKAVSDDYTITIKSLIYTEEYFRKPISLKIPYSIHRNDGSISSATLQINTASETLEDTLPFRLQMIEFAFMEKEIGLPFSSEIVINRFSIKEKYIVYYKDKNIKRYYMDPISRKYLEE